MSHPAYFIIHVDIHDPEGMKPYQAQVAATFTQYGGKRIVMGGAMEIMEGALPPGKVVIVQFPSVAQAHAWHDSSQYQAILGHRLAASTGHAYLVEGVAPAVSD